MTRNQSLQIFPFIDQPDQLRVGILLFSQSQPAWVGQIISTLRESSYADIALVVLCELDSEKNDHLPSQEKLPFFWRLFTILDKAKFERRVENSEAKNIDTWFQDNPTLQIQPGIKNGCLQLTEEDINKIRETHLDLILFLGTYTVEDDFIKSTKYGIWPYCNQFYRWRKPTKVTETLFNLYKYGPAALDRDIYTSTLSPTNVKTFRLTSNLDAIKIFWKLLVNKIRNSVFDFIYRSRWEMAYQFNANFSIKEFDFSTFQHIKSSINQIHADPFPVMANGKYYLFFEDMNVNDAHYTLSGCISVLEVDPIKGTTGNVHKVLERDYHLSYPFVFLWEGSYYMIPETHQNKTVELYRCLSFPDQWELYKVLLDDIPAMDATLLEKNGLWWLFISTPQTNNGNDVIPNLHALHLYYAQTPLGPWQPHLHNPVKLNYRSTRPAGKIFEWEGHSIRPTQDCSPLYGHAIIFSRIDELTSEKYRETEISKLLPPRRWDFLGVHTLNREGDLTVLDVRRYRNRFLP